jgi:hypothetical protein
METRIVPLLVGVFEREILWDLLNLFKMEKRD